MVACHRWKHVVSGITADQVCRVGPEMNGKPGTSGALGLIRAGTVCKDGPVVFSWKHLERPTDGGINNLDT